MHPPNKRYQTKLLIALFTIMPNLVMADWQIVHTIDIPVDDADYNEALVVSADNSAALVTIDSTDQFSVTPVVASLQRDSSGNWQSTGLLAPPVRNGVNQYFGCAHSVDGDTSLIGSCYRQIQQQPGDTSSNVTVYRKNNTDQWYESASLPVSDSYPQDQQLPSFGLQLALAGETAVVGLPGGSTETPNGIVLVFERFGEANWVHQATLRSNTPAYADSFGKAVSIIGNDLFVAERQLNGQVSRFTRNATSQWEFVELLALSDYRDVTFTSDLVSSDNTLLVPSTRELVADDGSITSVGIAHVVTHTDNGDWLETQTIEVTDSMPGSHQLAPRVAVNGNTIATQNYYYGQLDDGTFGSLQNQEIRIYEQSGEGSYLLSRKIDTGVPSTNGHLDIDFSGADILTGGTISDLLIINNSNSDDDNHTSGGGAYWLWAVALLLLTKRRFAQSSLIRI